MGTALYNSSGIEHTECQCQLGLEAIHPQSAEMFLYGSQEGELGRAPVVS